MGLRPSAPRADVSTVPPRPHENGASTGTCAVLSVLPRQSVAFYGLDAWSKRKDLHLRSPSGRRVYSALHLLLFARAAHCAGTRTAHPLASLGATPSPRFEKMGARAGFAPATISL